MTTQFRRRLQWWAGAFSVAGFLLLIAPSPAYAACAPSYQEVPGSSQVGAATCGGGAAAAGAVAVALVAVAAAAAPAIQMARNLPLSAADTDAALDAAQTGNPEAATPEPATPAPAPAPAPAERINAAGRRINAVKGTFLKVDVAGRIQAVEVTRATYPRPADEKIGRGVKDRADAAGDRQKTWTQALPAANGQTLQQLAPKLEAILKATDPDFKGKVTKNTFASESRYEKLQKAARTLFKDGSYASPGRALAEFLDAADRFRAQAKPLNAASTLLGTAGEEWVMANVLRVEPITASGSGQPQNNEFDSVAVTNWPAGWGAAPEGPVLILCESKGAGSKLGTRQVTMPDGTTMDAEQGTLLYMRDTMPLDAKLAEELDAQDLRAEVQELVDARKIRYIKVHTSAKGDVTVSEFVLDQEQMKSLVLTLPETPESPS